MHPPTEFADPKYTCALFLVTHVLQMHFHTAVHITWLGLVHRVSLYLRDSHHVLKLKLCHLDLGSE